MGFCFWIADAGFVEKPEDGELFYRDIALLLFEPGCIDLFDDVFKFSENFLRGFLAIFVELDHRIRFFTNGEKVGRIFCMFPHEICNPFAEIEHLLDIRYRLLFDIAEDFIVDLINSARCPDLTAQGMILNEPRNLAGEFPVNGDTWIKVFPNHAVHFRKLVHIIDVGP